MCLTDFASTIHELRESSKLGFLISYQESNNISKKRDIQIMNTIETQRATILQDLTNPWFKQAMQN